MTTELITIALTIIGTGGGLALFMDRRIDSLDRNLNQRIRDLNTHLDTRIDGLEKRMDGLEKRMDSLEKRMDGLDAKHGQTTRELMRLGNQVAALTASVDILVRDRFGPPLADPARQTQPAPPAQG